MLEASARTNDKEIGERTPRLPAGPRRRGPICFVAAAGRYVLHRLVAAASHLGPTAPGTQSDPNFGRAPSRGKLSGGRRLLVSLSLLLFGWMLPVAASSFQRDDGGAELVARARDVLVGRLLARESFRSPDGRFIFTRYMFRRERTLKGQPEDLYTLVEYGGRLGEMSLTVSHTPDYRVGRRYLILSRVGSRGWNQTLNGIQGELPVVEGPAGQLFIRVYPQHPLYSLVSSRRGGQFFTIDQMAAAVRQAHKDNEKR